MVLPARLSSVPHLGMDTGARRRRAEARSRCTRRRHRLRTRRLGRRDGGRVPEVHHPRVRLPSAVHRDVEARAAGKPVSPTARSSPSRRRTATRARTTSSVSSTAWTTWATRWASPDTRVEHLNPGGTVLLVEPMALDGRATNIAENPLAWLLYAASSTICTPNSLSRTSASASARRRERPGFGRCSRRRLYALPPRDRERRWTWRPEATT